MNKVGSYGVYQNKYYENTMQSRKEKEASKTAKADETVKSGKTQLSSRAKALLQKLQKTYGNMDFMIADYETEEEAKAYLSRGTKEYSVLIEPDVLEEMAADEEAEKKYSGILEDAVSKLADMKSQLGDKKDETARLGVSIGKDGELSYFAELEKVNEKQRERIEKAREDKKEESAKGMGKKVSLKADSPEELLEKIRNVDWSKIKEEKKDSSGSRINFTV